MRSSPHTLLSLLAYLSQSEKPNDARKGQGDCKAKRIKSRLEQGPGGRRTKGPAEQFRGRLCCKETKK